MLGLDQGFPFHEAEVELLQVVAQGFGELLGLGLVSGRLDAVRFHDGLKDQPVSSFADHRALGGALDQIDLGVVGPEREKAPGRDDGADQGKNANDHIGLGGNPDMGKPRHDTSPSNSRKGRQARGRRGKRGSQVNP